MKINRLFIFNRIVHLSESAAGKQHQSRKQVSVKVGGECGHLLLLLDRTKITFFSIDSFDQNHTDMPQFCIFTPHI